MALAEGVPIAEAAGRCGAGLRTVKSWLAGVPAFTRRVRELRRQLTDAALGLLTAAQAAAVLRLKSLVLNGKSETVQLGAARAILELRHRQQESQEIEERLADVERRLEQQATGGRP